MIRLLYEKTGMIIVLAWSENVSWGSFLVSKDAAFYSGDPFEFPVIVDIDQDGTNELCTIVSWGSFPRASAQAYKYENGKIFLAYSNTWIADGLSESFLGLMQNSPTQVSLYGKRQNVAADFNWEWGTDYGILRIEGNKLVPSKGEKLVEEPTDK